MMKNIFRINRMHGPGQYQLSDIFTDIHAYGILSSIFADADEIAWVIANTQVIIIDEQEGTCCNEMFVDNDDGAVSIGLTHLRRAPDEILYLDIPIKRALKVCDWVKDYYWKLSSVEADKYTARTQLNLHDGISEFFVKKNAKLSFTRAASFSGAFHHLKIGSDLWF